MQVLSDISIEKVIDIDDFISIQSELANLVNFSVVTVRPDGVPIGQWSNFTPFCRLIRSSEAGYRKCVACDKKHSLVALQKGQPQIYNCHCGLKDCAAPIAIDGNYIGCVLGGQVLIDEAGRKNIPAEKLAKEFDLPYEALKNAAAEVDVVSEDYLQRCINFYSFLANYVAEISVKKITQEKLVQETTEKMRLQKIAKSQELKRLQAQMNPHFLFNALNSIARTAMLEDAPQTESLIYDLSAYLRYSVKNTDDFPKLSQELENVRNYLSIQKTRFADRISFSIDFDREILDWRIPSMTLQPIVENAIIHGLEVKKEDGRLNITGRKVPGKMEMEVCVQDNGAGFQPEILELLGGGKVAEKNKLGLGLMNTHERLRQLFGPGYGLTVSSEPGRETEVRIKLPRKL